MALTWRDLACHWQQRFDRRRFLKLLGGVGLATLLRRVSVWAMDKPHTVDSANPPPPTPMPIPTSTPPPSPTSIVDTDFFSEAGLSPVFVAYDPMVIGYPTAPPFDPPEIYPEYPYKANTTAPDNAVYPLVRESLRLMAPESYGSVDWNPLGAIIRPGDTVLVKPNLVEDSGLEGGKITHPAIMRAVIDYAFLACGPTGRVLLAEGPWAPGVFDQVVASTGIQAMVEHLAAVYGTSVAMQDLNKVTPEESRLVGLGNLSELNTEDRLWYDAHRQPLQRDGAPAVGHYRIALPVLQADVIISLPKIKVHCMAGITLTMKNMVGIIPCWDGGYEDAALKDCAHTSDLDLAKGERGEYLDNDTIWRSIADLNRILLYADEQGTLHPEPQRRYLSIIDGIVAGTTSQFDPVPYNLSTIIVGFEPVPVDAVAARVMCFDYRTIKSIAKAALRQEWPLGSCHPIDIKVVVSGEDSLSGLFRRSLPPELKVYNWQGHIEATDFDPPVIKSWLWDEASATLRVFVKDEVGVAWMRLAYEHNGQKRLKALSLAQGTHISGTWVIPFPAGMDVRVGILGVCDALFNERWQTIGW
jgi:uncharacterized protein (DUF362 family)